MKTILATALLILSTSFGAFAKAPSTGLTTGGPLSVLMLIPHDAKLKEAGNAPTQVKSGASFDLEVSSESAGASQLQVTNAEGRVIRSVSVTLDAGVNRLHIKVKDLSHGLHFVRIQSGEQTLIRAFEVR